MTIERTESILDDLTQIVLPLMKPVPRAIWFVDCESKYHRFLNLVGTRHYQYLESDRYTVSPHTVCGLPLYPWNSRIATEEEKARVPAFCDTPGIWIEMSDGNHFQIKLKELEDDPDTDP